MSMYEYAKQKEIVDNKIRDLVLINAWLKKNRKVHFPCQSVVVTTYIDVSVIFNVYYDIKQVYRLITFLHKLYPQITYELKNVWTSGNAEVYITWEGTMGHELVPFQIILHCTQETFPEEIKEMRPGCEFKTVTEERTAYVCNLNVNRQN